MTEPLAGVEKIPVSPCVGICLVDPATGLCRGCQRSVAEIAAWYRASAAEKRAMIARLEARRSKC
jgi:predicted Fe-S protein YdhL (DUF1289 family)